MENKETNIEGHNKIDSNYDYISNIKNNYKKISAVPYSLAFGGMLGTTTYITTGGSIIMAGLAFAANTGLIYLFFNHGKNKSQQSCINTIKSIREKYNNYFTKETTTHKDTTKTYKDIAKTA